MPTSSRWVKRFARFPKVQVIDLDAAMGSGDNLALVRQIAGALTCRVGGGVRTVERAQDILGAGAQQVIAGSSLFKDGRPDLDFAKQLADAVGAERVIAAVDSRGGQVVIHGWKTALPLTAARSGPGARTLLRRVPLHPRRCRRADGRHQHRSDSRGAARHDAAAHRRRRDHHQEEIDTLDANGVDSVVGMAVYTGKLKL